jgi:hypothetical protein
MFGWLNTNVLVRHGSHFVNCIFAGNVPDCNARFVSQKKWTSSFVQIVWKISQSAKQNRDAIVAKCVMHAQCVVSCKFTFKLFFLIQGNLLGVRSQADLFYLQCNACQWTSRELGIPDRRTSNEQWPEPTNPLDEELGKVINIMKGLSTYERLEREKRAQTAKRLILF